MHGDFPCKYYYLGLKCIIRDCKFKHGKPLEDNIKQILLKHLDTAPKEILGDFPRIGRENATKMIAQTHIKLCKEFGIELPEAKIPSLLDMSIQPPDVKNKKQNRWGEARSSPSQTSTSSTIDTISPGDVVLANLKDILSEKQIDAMGAIGVITVSQINNLTVAQLNDIGLSFATIGEIQAAAIRVGNQQSSGEQSHEKEKSPEKSIHDVKDKDVDMRAAAAAESGNLSDTIKSPSSSIMSPNQSDADDVYKKPEAPLTKSMPMHNVLMSPPSGTLDLSQYLRDSNLNNDDEEENEPGLKIDENYYTSDHEQDEKKDSQSEDDQQSQDELAKPFDLLPPSFDSSNFFKSSTTTKIDVSSSVSQLMEMEAPKPVVQAESPTSTPLRDPRMRSNSDPRKPPPATIVKDAPAVPEIASPTYRDPRQQKVEPVRRASIYEIESPSEEEEVTVNIDKDKDMRFLNTDNGDIDLRFPFPPMANYVPATEIEASFGTHIFDTFDVHVVDVPKADYNDIRRSFRNLENTQDPRLKKLFGFGEAKQDSPRSVNSSSSTAPVDPRKRRAQEPEGVKKLQISTILQNSKHYNELSSSQKMVVNEVLAELTKELKVFHANASPSKIFDSSFITQRPKLQQVLIGLGVFVNSDGDFEEIKDVPNLAMMNMPKMPIPPPIIPTLTSLPISLNQPPPMIVRPGLLGFAPPPALPFASNIMDPNMQNDMNFSALNQMAFGGNDQFNQRNNNNNNSNNGNRRDQRQNFRNNNNNRNNNYRNRRN